MTSSFSQLPDSLVMVRPGAFGYNSDTAATNAFQHLPITMDQIHSCALNEFDAAVKLLKQAGVEVCVLEDLALPVKPDAIFPNNWFSIHEDGKMILYPMMATNRRLERDQRHVDTLMQKFGPFQLIDLSHYEMNGKFLEGTGSIVFDHLNKIAYACRSPRTNESVLHDLCIRIGYRSLLFDAKDESGTPIYHTNVMMCIGEKFAVLCLDSIHNEADQDSVLESLSASQYRVISISYNQMKRFAGNMMEVKSKAGQRYLMLSQNALDSLLPGQIHELTKHIDLLPVNIPTIEKYGGGGIRCMIAGIHTK
jgi:hypothetical protein